MVRGPFQEVQVVLNRVLLGFHQVWMLICLGLRVNRGVRDLLVKVCLLVVSNKDFWILTHGRIGYIKDKLRISTINSFCCSNSLETLRVYLCHRLWVADLETKGLCTKVKGLVVLDEVIQSLRWPECCNSLILVSCSRFFKVLDNWIQDLNPMTWEICMTMWVCYLVRGLRGPRKVIVVAKICSQGTKSGLVIPPQSIIKLGRPVKTKCWVLPVISKNFRVGPHKGRLSLGGRLSWVAVG